MRFFQIVFLTLVVISVGYIFYLWYKTNSYEYKLSSIIDSITEFQNQYIEKNTPIYYEIEKIKEKLNYLLTYNGEFKPMPLFDETLAELSVALMKNEKDTFLKAMHENYPSLRIGYVYNCNKNGKLDVCSYESKILNQDSLTKEDKQFLLKKASIFLNQKALLFLAQKNLEEIRQIKKLLKNCKGVEN